MNSQYLSIACLTAMFCLASASAEAQFRRFGRDSDSTPSASGLNPVHEKTKTEAQSAYQKRDFQRAIDLTSSVLRANPRDDVAYYLRASSRVELGLQQQDARLVRQGIADAREAIRFKGATNSIYYIPYFYGMTNLAMMEDRPEHAEVVVKYATQTIDRDGVEPEDKAHLRYQRARAYMVLGRFDEAIDDFQAATQAVPNQLGFQLDLADAHARAGQPDEAASAYEEIIRRFPDEPVVYNNRGMFLQRQGKPRDAIADFTQALQLNPRFFFALTNRGFALLKTGDAVAAESDLTASLKLDPNQARAYGLRASARLAQGRIEEGIADHQRAVELDAGNPVGWADLGYARFFAGDYGNALAAFNKALEIDEGRRYLNPWRYLAMSRAQGSEAASRTYGDLINADAAGRDWIDHLLVYLSGGIDDETLVQSVNPKPAVKSAQLCEAHYFIAQRHVLAGETDVAAKHYQQAIDTGAKHLAAYRGASFALKKVSTGD